MSNPRIRSAWLAFFLGTFGIDMLTLRPHQQLLFLLLGGPVLAITVTGAVLSVTQAGAWAVVGIGGLVFMEFWAKARFFEYLSLSDEQFQELLDESNGPAHHLAPQLVEVRD